MMPGQALHVAGSLWRCCADGVVGGTGEGANGRMGVGTVGSFRQKATELGVKSWVPDVLEQF